MYVATLTSADTQMTSVVLLSVGKEMLNCFYKKIIDELGMNRYAGLYF